MDALARRVPVTDDLRELAAWLQANGHAHLSLIERIELAERLITRRRFIIGAGALALGAITGCGAGEQAAAPTATVATTTRSFAHARGTTEIPVQPQRIVALGDLLLVEPLLQLGVTPVGTVESVNVFSDISTIAKVGDAWSPNLEAITALKPDLILADHYTDTVHYDEIAAIAPTVFFADPNGADALERQRIIADIVGKSGEFDTLFAAYEQRIAEVRERLGSLTTTLEVAVLNPYETTMYAYRGTSLGGPRVLADLGIALSRGVRDLPDDGSPFPAISFELLPQLDADVIFALFDPRSDEAERDVFRTSPILAQMFAAQKDQVFAVTSDSWFGGSLRALNLVLDDIERSLLDQPIDTSGAFR